MRRSNSKVSTVARSVLEQLMALRALEYALIYMSEAPLFQVFGHFSFDSYAYARINLREYTIYFAVTGWRWWSKRAWREYCGTTGLFDLSVVAIALYLLLKFFAIRG